MNSPGQHKQLDLWDVIQLESSDGIQVELKPTTPQKNSSVVFPQKLNLTQALQLSLFQLEQTPLDKLIDISSDRKAQKSFQTLSAGLILGGSSLSPYSNELCLEIFNALLLPNQAGFVDSTETLFNGSVSQKDAHSWFSITASSHQNQNSLPICCPSETVEIAGITDNKNISEKLDKSYGKNNYKKSKNPTPNKSLKIPVFPCKELHQIWKQWLAAYRWVYNQCVEFLNSGQRLPRGLSLDQHIQNLQSFYHNQWTLCLGKTRQEAVAEAEQAFKQARRNSQKGVQPKIKFRSCRDSSQVIQFKNDAFKSGTWFPRKVQGKLFCTAYGYEFPQDCNYGTELAYQLTKHGYQWFAIFPQLSIPQPTNTSKVIAFDPGVRCFLTGFDGENILEIAKGDIGRIVRLCLHLDNLISRKVKSKGKQKKKLRAGLNRAIKRLRYRIKCLVDDLHRKTSSLLVSNYKLIFLPTYQTSQMVLKATRKISKKSVRSMLTWA